MNGNGSLTLARDSSSGVILGPAASDTMEYDFLVPGPGTLVWHVDESVADFFGARSDPGFGLNVNRSRFGLDIIEGDGLDDLGDFNTPYPLGASTDPWYVGNRLGESATSTSTTVPTLTTNSGTDPAPRHPVPHAARGPNDDPGRAPVGHARVARQGGAAARGISPLVTALGPLTDSAPKVAWTGADSALHVCNLDGSPEIGGGADVVLKASAPLGTAAEALTAAGRWLTVAEQDASVSGGALDAVMPMTTGAGPTQRVVLPASRVRRPLDAGRRGHCRARERCDR